MKEIKAAVSIAGLCFELKGSMPLLNKFVCHLKEKSDGQICCMSEPLYDGTEKTVVHHDDVIIYLRDNGSWLYASSAYSDAVQVALSADYKSICCYIKNPEVKLFEQIFRNLLRIAFESVLTVNSRFTLHSSCVDVNGEAVAFTGVSGMGKSTRANAWISANNAEFISGDRPALSISSDGITAYGVPWDGKEHIFRSVECPLKAVLDVRRSDSDYLRKLTPEQAQRILMTQVFIPVWDNFAAAAAILNIRKLSKILPIYRVFCGPDEESAKKVYDILLNNPDKILEAAEEMKIKEGFVLRKIADEYIVMPMGSNIAKFDGAIALNDVSAFIFEKMQNPVSKEDLLIAVLNEYDVDSGMAARDIDALISKFEEMGIIE